MKKSSNMVALLAAGALLLGGCRDWVNPWDPGNPGGGSGSGLTIPEMYGIEWQLEAYEVWERGKVASSRRVSDLFTYTLTFTEEGVYGQDECNMYTADYTAGIPYTLSIFSIYEPQVACGPASGTTTYIDALGAAESYRGTETMLRIFYEGGTKALRYKRAAQSIEIVPLELIMLAPSDPYDMLDATIGGDVLSMHVRYGGGCTEHAFKLYGPKYMDVGDPTPATAYLVHRANGDPCKALVTQRRDFDLTPLRDHWRQLTGRNSGQIALTIDPLFAGGTGRTILYRF